MNTNDSWCEGWHWAGPGWAGDPTHKMIQHAPPCRWATVQTVDPVPSVQVPVPRRVSSHLPRHTCPSGPPSSAVPTCLIGPPTDQYFTRDYLSLSVLSVCRMNRGTRGPGPWACAEVLRVPSTGRGPAWRGPGVKLVVFCEIMGQLHFTARRRPAPARQPGQPAAAWPRL